jgi:phosphoribosylformylglycinamidine synthase I
MAEPNVCILKTDGINCDAEMGYTFESAGGEPELVHVNQLRSGERTLGSYAILAIPGGFSYGDDIASGQVLANEMTSYLSDQLGEFTDKGKPILGICNGFQVLVRTGLLPGGTLGDQRATLARNESGHFECRWIDLAVGQSVCKFLQPEDIEDDMTPRGIPMQVAHGEGRFFASAQEISRLRDGGQVVFRYANTDGSLATGAPQNPNGSVDNIAGICDPSGTVLGMMPHPERSLQSIHPHRIRTGRAYRTADTLFTNIVNYAKEL